MSKNKIEQLMQSSIKKSLKISSTAQLWKGTPFADIKNLEISRRGNVGEDFVRAVLEQLNYTVEDNPSKDADWDLRVDCKTKLEIKTATLGNNKFQHDNIRKNRKFDALILIGIAPNDIYLTCAAKKTLPWNRKTKKWTKTSKKMHFRKDKKEYKWELSLSDVENRRINSIEDFDLAYKKMLQDLK